MKNDIAFYRGIILGDRELGYDFHLISTDMMI